MDIRDFVFILIWILVILLGLTLYFADALKSINSDVLKNKNAAKDDYRFLNNRINELMTRVNAKKDKKK